MALVLDGSDGSLGSPVYTLSNDHVRRLYEVRGFLVTADTVGRVLPSLETVHLRHKLMVQLKVTKIDSEKVRPRYKNLTFKHY